jgi:hypothetical protein
MSVVFVFWSTHKGAGVGDASDEDDINPLAAAAMDDGGSL